MRLLALLSFALLSCLIDGLKILAILPHADRSQWLFGHAIVRSLVAAGHEATVVSAFALENPIKGYREIDISRVLAVENADVFEVRNKSALSQMLSRYQRGNEIVEAVMSHDGVRELMSSKEKFDVCLLENFNVNALVGVFEDVGCTFLPFTSSPSAFSTDIMTSNQSPPSYVHSSFSSHHGKMDFSQRFLNTFYVALEYLIYHTYHLPIQRAIYYKHFPNAKRSLDKVIASSRIMFTNTHISLTGARPRLPNIVDIAGVHIERAKTLPKELKEVLDFADTGVVVVSLDSSDSSYRLPTEKRETLTKAFGEMKQKVIWKYENDTLPNKPENVIISRWLPQRDLLAHHNAKILITFGGTLSVIEALADKVPILGIPMAGDQRANVGAAVELGWGLSLDFDTLSVERIVEAVNELITNAEYKKNAEKISRLFNDRTIDPNQAVVYWTESIVRNNGNPQLQSAGRRLSFIKYHSIDVYFALLLLLFTPSLICFVILRKVYFKIRPRGVKKIKKE